MLTRLQTGYLAETQGTETETSIEKDAMLVYPGKFKSMDGEVEVTDDHLTKLAERHNGLLSRVKRMATGEIPLKDCPPIQLDHEPKATHTVGRLVGPIEVKDTEIDGQKMKALFGRVRVLGKENVEKVKDGRWIHLSIGADLDKGELNELTITPFPAAPRAAMLSRMASDFELEKRMENILKKIGVSATVGVSGHSIAIGVDNPSDAKRVREYLGKTGGVYEVVGQHISSGGQVIDVVVHPDRIKMSSLTRVSIERDKETGKFFIRSPGGDVVGGGDYNTVEEAKAAAIPWVKRVYGDKAEFTVKMNGETEGGIHIDIDSHKGEEEEEKKMTYKEMKERMSLMEKCRKHMMEEQKKSEEDAEKHLSEMDDDAMKKMAADEDEREMKLAAAKEEADKLAAEEVKKADEAKMSRLSKAKEAETKLSAALEGVKLAQAKTKIMVRLSGLKASGRVTPAEIKALDIEAMAKDKAEITDAKLSSFEKREPVIDPRVYGTVQATNVSKILSDVQMSALEEETRSRFSSVPKSNKGEKFTKAGITRMSDEKTEESKKVKEVSMASLGDLEIIHKMMEEGKHDEAKEMMKKLTEACRTSMGDAPMDKESAEKHLSALAEAEKTLENALQEHKTFLASFA